MLSDDQQIAEVTLGDLDRQASALVRRAEKGERLIVTRHGTPVAVIVSIDGGLELMLATSERFESLRRKALVDHAAGRTVEAENPIAPQD